MFVNIDIIVIVDIIIQLYKKQCFKLGLPHARLRFY